ncbi:MAG TPA: Crp/Fnr family transcriptional regulator [Dehalococcoidia bacterium]|nr:Crp/Fnr family transcriptional regulator [Dehalococcoidia bacterium]
MSPLFKLGLGRAASSVNQTSSGDSVHYKLGLLKAAELFRGFSEEQMQQVERMTVMARCERGRVIYAPGETGEGLFLLKQGKVQIYRITPEGKKLTIAAVSAGTLFGDMPFAGQTMRDSFAEALEPSTLCVMSRHDLEELIRLYPEVGIRLADNLSRRVKDLESRLEESALRDMHSRVAAALLRVREREGSDRLMITHQELAEIVGTYRETVTRILGELRDAGVIDLERRCISIKEPAALRALIASEI